MHLFDVDNHMYGGNGIVGGHIPVATGTAFKIKYNEEDGVVLCYFGDGAIHQGAFHESLNLAKIWNLPIVYICENNQYGMGTDFRRVSAVHDLSTMGQSYGIPGKQVNGMDVIEVYDATVEAVKQAKEQHLSSLLEIRTYRYKGHSMSDPGKYRTREELDEYRQQDPIVILRQAMTKADLLTDAEYEKMDAACRKTADESVDFAEDSPEPVFDDLYADVLV
jgi:pyruvate dehydrogenase E1 component alpha subunit